MYNPSTQEIILFLLGHAIGNSQPMPQGINDVDWEKIISTAVRNGVATLAFNGFVKCGLNDDTACPLNKKENRRLKLTWMGLDIPQRKKYEHQLKVLHKLDSFFKKHDIHMEVLKGYPLSLCYPIPELRVSSDIDIYCPGNYERSNKLIEQTGVTVDYSQHKHSVFVIDGISIENHHSFLNVHGHKSSAVIEHELKKQPSWDASHTLLYLLRHSAENFTASQATLRQVTDCGLFVRKHHDEIDWNWLTGITQKTGMNGYLALVNAICVEYLGFDKTLFPEYCIAPALLERGLNDIISPEFSEEHPSNILSEVCYKFRRWHANTWKHRLVYANESLISTFLTQTWSHILKPSSITFGMEKG